jgi:soluble lytic murein transglycosylase-like protein
MKSNPFYGWDTPIWICAAVLAAALLASQCAMAVRMAGIQTRPEPLRPSQVVPAVVEYAVASPEELLPPRNEADVAWQLLVEAVVQVESRGEPRCVGQAGERGLMQIKSATWRETTAGLYGDPIPFDRAFEPNLNRQVGTGYLVHLRRFLRERRADWKADERSLLLACYNSGPTSVLAAGFDLAKLSTGTRDYVERVGALHDQYRRLTIQRANATASAPAPLRLAQAGP